MATSGNETMAGNVADDHRGSRDLTPGCSTCLNRLQAEGRQIIMVDSCLYCQTSAASHYAFDQKWTGEHNDPTGRPWLALDSCLEHGVLPPIASLLFTTGLHGFRPKMSTAIQDGARVRMENRDGQSSYAVTSCSTCPTRLRATSSAEITRDSCQPISSSSCMYCQTGKAVELVFRTSLLFPEWANKCLGYAWGQLDLRDITTGLPPDRLPPLLSPLLALTMGNLFPTVSQTPVENSGHAQHIEIRLLQDSHPASHLIMAETPYFEGAYLQALTNLEKAATIVL